MSGVFINRNFGLLWVAGLISSLGDFAFEAALLVWIAGDLAEGQAWAPYATSIMLAASAIPVFIVGPVAGVFVDRWQDKRRIMIRANIVSAALILVLLILTGLLPLPVRLALPLSARLTFIVTVVLLASIVAQFFRPASSVLVRDVVPDAHLERASSLNQTSTSLALLVGPPLATPLVFTAGRWGLTP